MIIYTDNIPCADRFLTGKDIPWRKLEFDPDDPVAPLLNRVCTGGDLFVGEDKNEKNWSYLLIAKTAAESQYDILIEMGRENIPLPHGILCLAGEGRKFHGFKGRHWDSPEGNIYLSAHFAPKRPVENYGAGFMILAAVSVVDAIEEIPELSGKASIKWVNDILIDGAKVCGVLAHTMAEADKVTNAVIGIGLNVETTPDIKPNIFVPKAAPLREFEIEPNKVNRATLFQSLTRSIYKCYLTLAGEGYHQLLNRYRHYSNIPGRNVIIYDDAEIDSPPVVAEGKVLSINDNLELILEGRKDPVKRGRLVIK